MSDPVWQHVKRIENVQNRVQCKHCGKELNRNPTYLKQHIISANCTAPDDIRKELAARLVAGRHRKEKQRHRDRALEAARRTLQPEAQQHHVQITTQESQQSPELPQHARQTHSFQHTLSPHSSRSEQTLSSREQHSRQKSSHALPTHRQQRRQKRHHRHHHPRHPSRSHRDPQTTSPSRTGAEFIEGDTYATTPNRRHLAAVASLTVSDVARALRSYVCAGLDDPQQSQQIAHLLENGVQNFLLSGVVLVSDTAHPDYLAESVLRQRTIPTGALQRDGIFLAVIAFIHDARRGNLDLSRLLGRRSPFQTERQMASNDSDDSPSSSEKGAPEIEMRSRQRHSEDSSTHSNREKNGQRSTQAGVVQPTTSQDVTTSRREQSYSRDDTGAAYRNDEEIDEDNDEDQDDDEDAIRLTRGAAGPRTPQAIFQGRTEVQRQSQAQKEKPATAASAEEQPTSDDENSI